MAAKTQLNLPAYDVELRRDEDSRRGGLEIYDRLRRKWIALTPEEWVRQHFVNFLITHRAFPGELMANEVALKLNNTARRADTLVYTRSLKPLCVIEYKAPDIVLTQNVFDRIARYNSVIEAPYRLSATACTTIAAAIRKVATHFCERYHAIAICWGSDFNIC